MSTIKYSDPSTFPNEFKPVIFDMSMKHDKIPKYDSDFSSNIDHPSMTVGFQQFFHANIIDMRIIKEFKGRKKVYTVTHTFNEHIDDFDTDLEKVSVEYFKLKNDVSIVSTDFYKLWEMIPLFKLIDNDKKLSALILSDNSSILQSIIKYRNVFSDKNQKDTYNVFSQIEQALSSFDERNKKQIDITKFPDDSKYSKNVQTMSNKFKSNVDLVIGAETTDWKYDILLEQKMTNKIIYEIACALSTLNNGGNFICRIFESFTPTMCKLLYILTQCFDEVYLTKPLMSHLSTSEKFIVCKKYSQSQSQKYVDHMNKLIIDIESHDELNLVSIYSSLRLPITFNIKLTMSNTIITNNQIEQINKILKFINSQNYFGDSYIEYKQKQINATTYWINLFYPNTKEINQMTKNLDGLKKDVVSSTNKFIDNMSKFIDD